MPQVSQQSPITTLTLENALLAIPTHAGIGMQRRASRPVWRYASNSRRDRTQNISIETHNRHEMSAKRGDRTSTPDKLIPRTPIPNYAFRIAPSPRDHRCPCRSQNRPDAALRRRTIYYPIKRNIISSRQRGQTLRSSQTFSCASREKAHYIKGRHSVLTRGRNAIGDIHIPPAEPRQMAEFDGYDSLLMQKNVKIRLNRAENDAF